MPKRPGSLGITKRTKVRVAFFRSTSLSTGLATLVNHLRFACQELRDAHSIRMKLTGAYCPSSVLLTIDYGDRYIPTTSQRHTLSLLIDNPVYLTIHDHFYCAIPDR